MFIPKATIERLIVGISLVTGVAIFAVSRGGTPLIAFVSNDANVPSNTCGDGAIRQKEKCDDSNQTPQDGCTACKVDAGWACTGEPSDCKPICGDKKRVGSEKEPDRCDDGTPNDNFTDGCSFCAVTIGWQCTGEPSSCIPICGDGFRVGSEKDRDGCDDGNVDPTDGCHECKKTLPTKPLNCCVCLFQNVDCSGYSKETCTPYQCADGLDNDRDGQVDFDDPQCKLTLTETGDENVKNCAWNGDKSQCYNIHEAKCPGLISDTPEMGSWCEKTFAFDREIDYRVDPTLQKNIKACTEVREVIAGHGRTCLELEKTIVGCQQCTTSACKRIGIVDRGCSVFRNTKSFDKFLENFKKSLKQDETYTIVANQSDADYDKCTSFKKYTITRENIEVSYDPCNTGKLCRSRGDIIRCMADGEEVSEICCVDDPIFSIGIWKRGDNKAVCAKCGNGIVEAGEKCDDKNSNETDACLTTCEKARCGDSIVWKGKETCDDGNTVSGDGCSDICLKEFSGKCAASKQGPASLTGSCANIRNKAYSATKSCLNYTQKECIKRNGVFKYLDPAKCKAAATRSGLTCTGVSECPWVCTIWPTKK